jgi:transposase
MRLMAAGKRRPLLWLAHLGLVAPLVIEGPINGDIFRAWVEQMQVPALQPGDMVVLDNLGSHKVAGVEEAIRTAGAQLLYLPPYSPDYNPIEQVFAKLKTLLRKAAASLLMNCGPPSAICLVNLLRTSACNISALPT